MTRESPFRSTVGEDLGLCHSTRTWMDSLGFSDFRIPLCPRRNRDGGVVLAKARVRAMIARVFLDFFLFLFSWEGSEVMLQYGSTVDSGLLMPWIESDTSHVWL